MADRLVPLAIENCRTLASLGKDDDKIERSLQTRRTSNPKAINPIDP